jgi:hypothetical protein
VDLLRVIFGESGHHLGYLYDLPTLSTELITAGFVEVQRFEVGQSEDLVLRNLESRSSDTEAKLQLVVEAQKPRSNRKP